MLRTITVTIIIVQMIFNFSVDFCCLNFKFPCNVDQETVEEFVWFEDIDQKSANDWVNQHSDCNMKYVLASVDNGQNERMEKIEAISRNHLEDEQIQLLKKILETNPNL